MSILNRCSALAPGPKGWALLLQLSGKRGQIQPLHPHHRNLHHRKGTGGLLVEFLSSDPGSCWLCRQRQSPQLSGEPAWNPNCTKSKRGEESCRAWPSDAIRNDSSSFLGLGQKSLFFPASFFPFCCWIAGDDLRPEPTIYQNERVSQIRRPKGPLHYAVQPSAGDRPALLCLISALIGAIAATASFC